jgi:DNA-binding response OmpR family regulator
LATQKTPEAPREEQLRKEWSQQRLDAGVHAGRLRILVTGDDGALSSILEPLLAAESLEISVAQANGLSEEIASLLPHVVLVSIIEPDLAKVLWIQQLREDYRGPIVCVVPHPTPNEVEDFAALAADDYLFPPVSAAELESRVRLLLCNERLAKTGRAAGRGRDAEDSPPGSGRRGQQLPPIEISERERAVYCRGEAVHLPPKQYALLCLLASDPGRVFTHQEIIAALWPARRRVRLADLQQHVYALRKKIEPDPSCPCHILSVPGFGYRFLE